LIIEAVLLLGAPLFLSWATTWKMRQLKDLALRREEEVRVLKFELENLLEESRQAGRTVRHYATKQSSLLADLETGRAELQALRDPAPEKMAA